NTDPSHPVNAAKARGDIHSDRVFHYQLQVPSNQQTAVHVGQMMLAQLNAQRRAGTASITGCVYDDAGNRTPVHQVRGGDQIVWTDLPDQTPRRIMLTNYQQGPGTAPR